VAFLWPKLEPGFTSMGSTSTTVVLKVPRMPGATCRQDSEMREASPALDSTLFLALLQRLVAGVANLHSHAPHLADLAFHQ
jgi:hypothetical protein